MLHKTESKGIILFVLCSLFVLGCDSVDKISFKCPDCNVIIILVDALRFDHLSCYGYERNTSPNIDRLCEDGVIFKNAISQAPWTKPAVTSLFTSKYLQTHNISLFSESFTVEGAGNVLPASALTIAEVLYKNNYTTKAIIGNIFIKKGFGLEQGFEDYDDGPHCDEAITTKALDYINKIGEKRFFLYLHYMAPHAPYAPPSKYKARFKASYAGTIVFRDKHKFDIAHMSEEDLEELRARYDGEVNYIDEEIGKIVDSLKNQDLYNKTLIVFVADHGEGLGENDIIGHGSLTNTIVQVPLIIVNPDDLSGQEVESIVELIDVAPTILSALEIPIPYRFQGHNILQKSKQYGFSEIGKTELVIRTEDLYFKTNKLGDHELYNIKLDPFALVDIKEEFPLITNEFIKNYVLFKKLPKQDLISKEIDEETRKQLKALGYVN